MKKFFDIFLYLNVGIGSLFFVIWFFTTFSFFPNVSAEGNPVVAPSPPPAGAGGSASGAGGPVGAGAVPGAGSGAGAVPGAGPVGAVPSIPRKGASVDDNSIPPPPDIPPSAGSGGGADEPLPEDASLQGNNMEQSKTGPQAIGGNLKFQKNINANDEQLESLNQKIADIHSVLEGYRYESSERRDPFAPPRTEQQPMQESGVMLEDVLPDYPTGKYSLSDIKLVGIKWNSKIGASKALFQTADGIHQLQKNDRIGKKRGVIYQVREDGVIVLQPRMIGTIDKKGKSYTAVFMQMESQHKLGNQSGEYATNSSLSPPPSSAGSSSQPSSVGSPSQPSSLAFPSSPPRSRR